MYCTSCGTEFQGQYCPNCGKAANAAESPVGAPPPLVSPAVPGVPSNIASVLCYLVPIVGPVIFLVLAPYSRDRKIRFDAWQALAVHVAYVLTSLVIGILADISWRLSVTLREIAGLLYLILIVYLIVKAFQNEKVVLPVAGDFAAKQK